jgi:hypothetical protein
MTAIWPRHCSWTVRGTAQFRRPLPAGSRLSCWHAPASGSADFSVAETWGSATNHEPRTTNHEPRTTNHEPRTTNHEPRATSHELFSKIALAGA